MRRARTALLGGLAGLVALAAVAAGAAPAAQPSCPASDRPTPVAGLPAAAHALVPSGARSLLLCRYGGLGQGAAFRLDARPATVSDAATVARIARTLDALPAVTGPISCPVATGVAIVAYFRYAAGPDDPVRIDLDGCLEVTNGHVHRVAGVSVAGRRLVAAVEALVPTRRP